LARTKVEKGTPPEEPKPEFDAKAALAADVDASKKLVDVLEGADRAGAVEKAREVVFENANRATEKPVDARFPALVERTFRPKDWIATLDLYEAWLELGEKRSDEAFIRRAHERGPGIVQALWDAYFDVKYAREVWEMDNDVVFGAMREQAEEALENEKLRKVRTKTITEKDVATKCASMFPDEWRAQESKRLRFKLTEERAKSCVEVANSRVRVLESMMARLR
jgi:hypothetical protein